MLSRVRFYNEQRLCAALGGVKPVDYRGDPATGRRQLAQAWHRRRERYLQVWQPTLPFTRVETVAWPFSPAFVPSSLKQNIIRSLL